MARQKGKYETTINLDYPTTETLDIPPTWAGRLCPDCKGHLYIDLEKKEIHHKEPFCGWYHNIWLDKPGMAQEVRRIQREINEQSAERNERELAN